MKRLALWLMLRVPSGASWRFSRFAPLRHLGDWWLPRWYGKGVSLEDQIRDEMAAAYELNLEAARRKGGSWIPTKEEIASAHAARIEREIILGPEADQDV